MEENIRPNEDSNSNNNLNIEDSKQNNESINSINDEDIPKSHAIPNKFNLVIEENTNETINRIKNRQGVNCTR